MELWTELRTAWMVAKLGSVKATAKSMGVHRSTVDRRIDDLEAALGTKLFLRNPKGMIPTDAGHEILRVGNRADEMFSEFAGRIRGQEGLLAGPLIITLTPGAVPLIMPATLRFRELHPQIEFELVATLRKVELAYGEAHIALRGGDKPEDPDLVVLPYRTISFRLFGHKRYFERTGLAEPRGDFREHTFVSVRVPQAEGTLAKLIESARAGSTALATNDPFASLHGVLAGLGLGWIPDYHARMWPDLVDVTPPNETISRPLWFVTHVDAYRTAKVRAFKDILFDSEALQLLAESSASSERSEES